MNDDAAREQAEQILDTWPRLQRKECEEREWLFLRDAITVALRQRDAERDWDAEEIMRLQGDLSELRERVRMLEGG